MSITALVTMTVAEVEVNDEYRVTLRTLKRVTDYSPDEALQLADELSEAALAAYKASREDLAGRVPVVHGFDVDMPGGA